MAALLRESIRHRSVSGQEGPFVRFIADWARKAGFIIDLFETDDATIVAHPRGQGRHLPLAGRPTLVITLPDATGPVLMFNAHSDVVSADDDGWSGDERDGDIFGRGACDVKGPLIAALWAMRAIRRQPPPWPNIQLELVPGEEDCVGIGTLTSVLSGHAADASIILEPTELQPRCASRGGLRFEITCRGKAVHGTVKWLGQDAIRLLRRVLDALDDIEKKWNQREADPLFACYPITRPITVDRIAGGKWQGMVCDEALCAGYLELLPGDDLHEWRMNLLRELRQRIEEPIELRFSEEYHGHRLSPDDALMQRARAAMESAQIPMELPAGFNSGCEAGLRAGLFGTPTLVWGPGSLVHAHAADERIQWRQVHQAARTWAGLMAAWPRPG